MTGADVEESYPTSSSFQQTGSATAALTIHPPASSDIWGMMLGGVYLGVVANPTSRNTLIVARQHFKSQGLLVWPLNTLYAAVPR